MGDVGDYWNEHREYRRQQRIKNAPKIAKQVDGCVTELIKRGYQVIRFSEHHYRVDQRFDYWPTTGRWRAMDGSKRGSMLRPLLKALEAQR